jgi:hypothetical protein
MPFILSEQRGQDVDEAFRLYKDYLQLNEGLFPKSAYALATSEWYWDFTISGCPHDGWLKSLTINEPATGTRQENRTVEIKIELLSPYHDGVIEFHYPKVFGYRFNALDLEMGHRDWRYDEFRIDDSGNLIHEIEWFGPEATAKSWIVATDVIYKWTPLIENVRHTDRAKY